MEALNLPPPPGAPKDFLRRHYRELRRQSLPLARFDRKTLYTPGAAGYTDYPLA